MSWKIQPCADDACMLGVQGYVFLRIAMYHCNRLSRGYEEHHGLRASADILLRDVSVLFSGGQW